jgi:hypothetical protein
MRIAPGVEMFNGGRHGESRSLTLAAQCEVQAA